MSTVNALSAATVVGNSSTLGSIRMPVGTSSDEATQSVNLHAGTVVNIAGKSSITIRSKSSATLDLFTYNNPFKVPDANVNPDTSEVPEDQSQSESAFHEDQANLKIAQGLDDKDLDFGRSDATKAQAAHAAEESQQARQAETKRIEQAQTEPSTPEKKPDPVEPKKAEPSAFAMEAKNNPIPAEDVATKLAKASKNKAPDPATKNLGVHVDVKV